MHLYRMQLNGQIHSGLSLPGRDHGGGLPHPGCATARGGSTLCVEASFPASLLGSPLQNQLAPPASGSAVTTNKK